MIQMKHYLTREERCYDKQLKFQLVLPFFSLDDSVFFIILHNRKNVMT